MYHELINSEFKESIKTLNYFLKNKNSIQSIENAANIITNVFKSGKKVLSCGNGGSHCDAMHFAEELTCRYRNNRSGYPAIAISDPSYISCASNDFGYDQVFSRYIEAIGKEGDALVSISTSGNSNNILRAIETARSINMKVIVLTGNKSNKIIESADVEINVPHIGYADRIQEVHIIIIHTLILLIEKQMIA